MFIHFPLIIAVKLLRLGFHQPNLTATCTATIRLQHRGSFESGWEGPGSASQDHKDRVRVTLFHRSPSSALESWVTFLRNLKLAHMVYLLLLSNVLLQDYMEVNQPWGEKSQYGLILLEHCCFPTLHTCCNNTDKAAQCWLKEEIAELS